MTTPKNKLVAFLILAAMIVGGLYLLTALSIIRNTAVAPATALALGWLLGVYLLWTDIVAPALGIKTTED